MSDEILELITLLNEIPGTKWDIQSNLEWSSIFSIVSNPEQFVTQHFPYYVWDEILVWLPGGPRKVVHICGHYEELLQFLKHSEPIPSIGITYLDYKRLNEQFVKMIEFQGFIYRWPHRISLKRDMILIDTINSRFTITWFPDQLTQFMTTPDGSTISIPIEHIQYFNDYIVEDFPLYKPTYPKIIEHKLHSYFKKLFPTIRDLEGETYISVITASESIKQQYIDAFQNIVTMSYPQAKVSDYLQVTPNRIYVRIT